MLADIARRHCADVATVASTAVLARPGVAAVIVGARDASHLPANLKIDSLALDETDLSAIAAVLERSSDIGGDVYDIERDTGGRHGRIMKYNLNSAGKEGYQQRDSA